MTLIVDASVAVKWYVDEPLSEQAANLLHRDDLAAPELIFSEVANALWKSVRLGTIGVEQGRAALSRLGQDLSAIHALHDLADAAFSLADELRHPVYDCFYLALARREGAALATADQRLAALAGQVGVPVEPLR